MIKEYNEIERKWIKRVIALGIINMIILLTGIVIVELYVNPWFWRIPIVICLALVLIFSVKKIAYALKPYN